MSSPDDHGLERLRTVDRADVYKSGRLAAALIRTANGLQFDYRADYLDSGGPPVATTLPLRREPLLRPAGSLPSYFAGLLPEGRRLGALRRAVKTSADDELSLLLAVGADAVGDVQVVPAGTTPDEVPPRIAIEDLATVSFAELLLELGIRAQRMALPGVQDKTSAAMINLPVSRAGERYILKLNPVREYPHLVENEHFFLGAARASGLAVPDCSLVRDRDGSAGLLVRRFDRITVDGGLRLRSVEDGCQVADRPPADKYLLDTRAVFEALVRVCDAPVLAGRDLVRQLAFAYLTGNGDAHAKNFSVVQDETGEWQVSPAYDVPSSQPYGDTTMALAISGRTGPEFDGSDFIALGEELHVPARATRRVLDDLVARCDTWLPELDQLPFARSRVAKLRRVIGGRRSRLTSRVAGPGSSAVVQRNG